MKKLLCAGIIIGSSFAAVFAAEDLTFYSVYKDHKAHLEYPVQSGLFASPLVYSILASTSGLPWFSPVPVSSQPVLAYQFLPSTTNSKTLVKISMRPVSVSGQFWNTCGQLIQVKSIAEKHGASVLDEGTHYHLNFKSKADKDYDEYNICY